MTNEQLNWQHLLCPLRRKDVHDTGESMNTGLDREELERDYDRILFAAPTRRLADKTQVFPMETNDSVRTRLTHSHEVSNLARSIGVKLAYTHRKAVFGEAADELRVERQVPALLAAVGLAHDLGNPPYGHQGEQSIGYWFRDRFGESGEDELEDFLKFDGNCQTFRLLTRLQFLNDEFGLNLTYATLAALMKYPIFAGADRRGFGKFGLFRSEREIAQDVWAHTGLEEGLRHPLAFVMEACDDIAYSVIDAEDTVKKGYASFYDLVDYLRSDARAADKVTTEVVDAAIAKNNEFKSERLSSKELNDLSMLMFRVKAISVMVESATHSFVSNVDKMMGKQELEGFELIKTSASGDLCQSLKDFDNRYGFRNPEVLRLELEGHNYITETMDMLWEGIEGHRDGEPFARYAYGRISENYRRVYGQGADWPDKAHLLCDTISGMGEGYLRSVCDSLKQLRKDARRR